MSQGPMSKLIIAWFIVGIFMDGKRCMGGDSVTLDEYRNVPIRSALR